MTLVANSAEVFLTENNSVIFNQPFTSEYVAKKQLEVFIKDSYLSKSEPIYIVMDTPGGSVTAGLAFIDAIKSLKRPVNTVTLFAASMGYQVVQELGTRIITPSGTLMSHRGAVSGMSGQIPGELNSRLNFITNLLDGMNNRAAKRVGMSVLDYKSAIINELWTFGHQAVLTKHADIVANVKCDKKLSQSTYKERIITIFGGVDIIYSKCPIISSPVGYAFSKELKEENKFKVVKYLKSMNRKVNLTL